MILQSLLVLHVPLVSHLPNGMGLCWELLKSSWFLCFQGRVGAALGACSGDPRAMGQEAGLSFPLSKVQPPTLAAGLVVPPVRCCVRGMVLHRHVTMPRNECMESTEDHSSRHRPQETTAPGGLTL